MRKLVMGMVVGILLLGGCTSTATSVPPPTQLTDAQLKKLAPGRAVSLGNGTAVYHKASPAPAAASNGVCEPISGKENGRRYVGFGCYLDSAPKQYVHSAKSFEGSPSFNKFSELIPKKPQRCVLRKKPSGSYDIQPGSC